MTNDSKEAVHVRMDGKSITGIVEKDLAPGESLRQRATAGLEPGRLGTITYSNGDKVPFWGYNPDIGRPSVGSGTASNWSGSASARIHHFTESGHQYWSTATGDPGHRWRQDLQISRVTRASPRTRVGTPCVQRSGDASRRSTRERTGPLRFQRMNPVGCHQVTRRPSHRLLPSCT